MIHDSIKLDNEMGKRFIKILEEDKLYSEPNWKQYIFISFVTNTPSTETNKVYLKNVNFYKN